MCGLIWLPRPRTNRPFDATLQVVGRRSPASSACGRTRPRSPVPSSSRSVCLRREHEREERVVAGLGGDAAVVAVGLERRRPARRSRRTTRRASRRPSSSRSLVTGSVRPRTLPGSASLSHPRGTLRSDELRAPLVAVAERLLVVQGVPARVPVLLPRAAPRAAVAVDHQGHARAPGARAPPRPPGRRAHARRRARRPRPRPGRARHRTPTSPTSSSPTRSGPRSTPTPSRSCAATSSSRTRARSARSAWSSSSRPTSAAPGSAASSTASSSTSTASSSSPTTRPARCRRELWEAKSLSGVHMYALLCERMLGKRPARVQLFYLSKPEAIIATPTDQSIRGVERKTAAMYVGDRHRVRAATTSARSPGACATSARSSRTARRTAATRSTPPSCAGPAR